MHRAQVCRAHEPFCAAAGPPGLLAAAGTRRRAPRTRPDRRGLWLQEVRILKGIRHPNVLFFRALCLQPPMIITELCDHGSVSDVLELTNRIQQPNAFIEISDEKRALYLEKMAWPGRVKMALDAAKGMLYLHDKDLLHCDLKSLNLLVDSSWTCKIADFGLSRYLSGKQTTKNTPNANNPMWQAPEVIEDSSACSRAGDVYSFGIVMYELLMMTRPWTGTPFPLIGHFVQVLFLLFFVQVLFVLFFVQVLFVLAFPLYRSTPVAWPACCL